MRLQEDDTDLTRRHDGALPVVEVVVQGTVTSAEFEWFEECAVFHEIKTVHDVNAALLGENECVVHELDEWGDSGDVVVGVCGTDFSVDGVTQDSRGEVIEGAKIGDFLGGRIFHHVRLHNAGMRENPVLDVSIIKVNGKGELFEVFGEKDGNLRNVFFAHLTNAGRLGFL